MLRDSDTRASYAALTLVGSMNASLTVLLVAAGHGRINTHHLWVLWVLMVLCAVGVFVAMFFLLQLDSKYQLLRFHHYIQTGEKL